MIAQRAIVALLLLASGAVACSDDDGAGSDTTGTAAGDGTTTTLESTTAPAATTAEPAELSADERAQFEIEVEYARCLREQGLHDLPDPQLAGSGYMLVGVPLDPSATEDYMAAQEACQYVVEDATPPDESDADPAGWERVVPGGDCQCFDGSEYNFWVREASPDKVVLYLQSGGGCFDAETCDPETGNFRTSIEGPNTSGIFDFADERNPFADYSVVYVPYCTGDVHLGNTTTQYAADLTIHHNGFVNGTAALDYLVDAFPAATQVVVVGESAGAIAAPLYAGLVSDRLPEAKMTVLADGAGSYPDEPRFNDILSGWGFHDMAPQWSADAEPTAEDWSAPELFVQSGRHDPAIVFARHDYAYDNNQVFWHETVGVPAEDLLSLIDTNETQIEGAGVNLLSYIAPGDEHTVLTDGRFYDEAVNGQSLVDWVTKLVEGESVDDVHCTQCTSN
jgi:Pectinacetylesterase